MAGKYGYPYFANFINSDMNPEDIRSMCPLTTDTKIFIKSEQKGISIAEIGDIYSKQNNGTQYSVFTKNGWEQAKINQFPKTKILEIKLSNGATVKMGENHLQPTKDNGTILAKDLTTEMWLPFNKKEISNNLGDYSLGYAVGAYAGDGSYSKSRIVYSLCSFEKDDNTENILTKFWNSFGFNTTKTNCGRNVRFLTVSSGSAAIIKKYINGDNALSKSFTRNIFNSSIDFKNGVIDGFRATDGARDKKRLYTSSKKLRDDLCSLLVSMGKKYMANYEDNRMGRLGTNTNYRIDFPERDCYGQLFKEDEDYNYFKIISINEYNNYKSNFLYCVELDNEDKLFSLANGLITHNCRLSLDLSELSKRNGGLFGSGDSTGSIGVCTINLPRLAYINSGNKHKFFKELNKILVLAKDSLEIKRKWLEENIIKKNAIPAFCHYVGTLQNHFSTIGVLGENEMCENFFGEGIDILTEQGKDFALEVNDFVRNKLLLFQEETGNLFNFEATPSESTCHRLAMKDKEEFDDIIVRGVENSYYYTNSCHMNVSKVENVKQLFDHQDNLQVQFTGGTVVHTYLNGSISGSQAKQIIRTICENYSVPYISLSPLNRYCKKHGYITEHVDKCPKCNSDLQLYQRITGYLRQIEYFNNGKKSEFKDRNQLQI